MSRRRQLRPPRPCRLCGALIPSSTRIDGRYVLLTSRKYCLTCSPFGSRNTRRLELPLPPSVVDEATRAWKENASQQERLEALDRRRAAWSQNRNSLFRFYARELQWLLHYLATQPTGTPLDPDRLASLEARIEGWRTSRSVRHNHLANQFGWLVDRAKAQAAGAWVLDR